MTAPHGMASSAPADAPRRHEATGTQPLGWKSIVAFASGDFAFNLYWQSLSLYLLFYYTDAVGLSPAAAGLIYMIASIWDGLIDPLIGMLADRTRTRWGRFLPAPRHQALSTQPSVFNPVFGLRPGRARYHRSTAGADVITLVRCS